ncbi:hypothetical protein P9139_11225 [Curtobacterium flaccumfaciens]|nr:hypothetical protein P9139_11225 [Curtobacterium flaccumfaciens]
MRIILSTTSSVPMYEQIKTQVRNAVHAGSSPRARCSRRSGSSRWNCGSA